MKMTVGEAIAFLVRQRRRDRQRAAMKPPPELQELEEPVLRFVPPPPPESPWTLALPVEGRISSPFGMRRHPVTGEHKPHKGVDIAAKRGTPITAAAAGKVTHSGPMGSYGITVIIDHENGQETLYAHMDSTAVDRGDRVRAGQFIGEVGSTGRVTGPHLHWEVRERGKQVDPAPYL